MKILVIPDIHQHPEGINDARLRINDFDKIVFLGDYVDDWESEKYWSIPKNNPINIVQSVVDLRKEYPDKIELLIGNHDLAYLSKTRDGQSISGHQFPHHGEISSILYSNLDNFNIVVEFDGWVFSHAGISKDWTKCRKNAKSIKDINNIFKNKDFDYFSWTGGDTFSGSGDGSGEGPLWIRPEALIADDWPNFVKKGQVVGHTEIRDAPLYLKQDKKNLIVVDSEHHDCFFELDTEKTDYPYKVVSLKKKTISKEQLRMMMQFMI